MISHKADLFLHDPDLVYFAKSMQANFIALNPAIVELIGMKSDIEKMNPQHAFLMHLVHQTKNRFSH